MSSNVISWNIMSKCCALKRNMMNCHITKYHFKKCDVLKSHVMKYHEWNDCSCRHTILFLASATKLRRLCFHRRLSVHGGVCLVRGVHGPGGCMVLGGLVSQHALRQPPPGRDGYCCGRYASYWNVFLFVYFFITRLLINPILGYRLNGKT